MKIGVFLAYMPGVKLTSEGLGRYIGNLIKGFLDDHNEVSIACPKWMIDPLYELFDDFYVNKDSVNIITTYSIPVIWRLYNWFWGKKHEKRSLGRAIVFKKFSDFIDYLLSVMVGIGSTALFVLLSCVLFLLFLVAAPFFLISLLFYFFAKVINGVIKKRGVSFGDILTKTAILYQTYSKAGNSIQGQAFRKLYEKNVRILMRKVETQNHDIWFVPSLFWPEVTELTQLTVFVAPDMVTTEFPFPFAESHGSVLATETCEKTIRQGKYFITYGEFIKKDVLMKRYCKNELNIRSIAHINNSSSEYVSLVDGLRQFQHSNKAVNDVFCHELLKQLPQYSTRADFLQNFDFRQVEYIFYASQQRPHKNILNLIKAYDYLVRTEHVHFKLFLTCDLDASPDIASFIKENGLENDVIAFKRVPIQLLSALYYCATLTVTPTLYEGAFLTFTIGESMSVGTPVIMGAIPQVTDMIPSVYPLEHILFDPLNYLDIAKKIMNGVQNAENLYNDELQMYEDIEKRTGQIVARDYVNAFHYFYERDYLEKEKLDVNK